MDELNAKTIQAIRDMAVAANDMPHDAPDGSKVLILPDGYQAHKLPPLKKVLTNVDRMETALTVKSFCDYVNRFKKPASQVFGDYRSRKVKAIVDYHVPGDETNVPDYCDHFVMYEAPLSDQFLRWKGIHEKKIGQREFIEFVEENYQDVVSPPHADLLDMLANLSAKKAVKFKSGLRMKDGSVDLEYGEDITTTGAHMTIPSEIELGIPVLHDGAPYKIRVLLRYRLDEGSLSFILVINRLEYLLRQAFDDVLVEIEGQTGIPVYRAAV